MWVDQKTLDIASAFDRESNLDNALTTVGKHYINTTTKTKNPFHLVKNGVNLNFDYNVTNGIIECVILSLGPVSTEEKDVILMGSIPINYTFIIFRTGWHAHFFSIKIKNVIKQYYYLGL